MEMWTGTGFSDSSLLFNEILEVLVNNKTEESEKWDKNGKSRSEIIPICRLADHIHKRH